MIAEPDFTPSEAYYPTATSLVITGNGTITSGKMRLVVEYTRPAPVSGV